MNHSQNSNCNAFNNRRMFEEFNGFTGYDRGSFDHTRDRDIDWLSARGTIVPPTSSPQPARETNPTDVDCAEHICGSYAGGGRKRCPSGCKCNRGTCAPKKGGRAVRPTGGSAPARQTAGGSDCGQKCGYRGGGVVRRCQNKGCVCDDINSSSGTCVSTSSKRGQMTLAKQRKNFDGSYASGRGSIRPTGSTARGLGTTCNCECGQITFYSRQGRRLNCEEQCRLACRGKRVTNNSIRNFAGDDPYAPTTGVLTPSPYNPTTGVLTPSPYNPTTGVLTGVTYTPDTTPSRRRKYNKKSFHNGGMRLR